MLVPGRVVTLRAESCDEVPRSPHGGGVSGCSPARPRLESAAAFVGEQCGRSATA